MVSEPRAGRNKTSGNPAKRSILASGSVEDSLSEKYRDHIYSISHNCSRNAPHDMICCSRWKSLINILAEVEYNFPRFRSFQELIRM